MGDELCGRGRTVILPFQHKGKPTTITVMTKNGGLRSGGDAGSPTQAFPWLEANGARAWSRSRPNRIRLKCGLMMEDQK
jgi:hypothetical protein